MTEEEDRESRDQVDVGGPDAVDTGPGLTGGYGADPVLTESTRKGSDQGDADTAAGRESEGTPT